MEEATEQPQPPKGQFDKAGPLDNVDSWVRIGELLFDILKWLDNQGTDSIKTAARTLWLSNAGGLALIIALATKSGGVNMVAGVFLFLAAATFVLGVYLGAIPHVTMAHRISTAFVKAGQVGLSLTQGTRKIEDLPALLQEKVPELEKVTGVLADHLVNAKRALATGAALGLIGFALTILDLTPYVLT